MLVIDRREPESIYNALIKLPATQATLKVGDYMFLDRDLGLNLVTRKAGDLYASLYSGHFQDELERCIDAINRWGSGRLWWLQEGMWAGVDAGVAHYQRKSRARFEQDKWHHGNPRSFVGLQLSLQAVGGMFIFTSSEAATVNAIVSLYNRGQAGWPSKMTVGPVRPKLRWSRDERVKHLMGLWPKLREPVAVDLLREFGTIRAVLNASAKELQGVDGVGKTGLRNLRQVMED